MGTIGITHKTETLSRVYNESWETGLKRFPNKWFDLAICDIPYGINVGNMPYLKETGTRVKQKNGSRLDARKNKKPYKQKPWDSEAPGQEYFNELLRVSKNQIIFGVEYVTWEGLGKGRIRWDKGVAEGMSFSRYETAYCSMIEEEVDLPLLWSGMLQAKSLAEPMTQQGNKKLNEVRIHPCQKPTLLYQKLIKDYGFKGMKLLDTHIGSGSIRIVADLANCSIIGFEIDVEYWEKQEKRFRDYKSQLRIFPLCV